MSSVYSLILDENEYDELRDAYKEFENEVDAKIEEYINLFTDLQSYAVADGEMHKKLCVFTDAVTSYKNKMSQVCENIISKTTYLQTEVDNSDQNFYE